ncbi:hypothetical protein ASD04_05620 [Devosia sp. Root436]|uniref:ARMT1-like domain-containing protein n=1 Tax=Devosia sp. Root436 TaxID=1736537 RepID=UPI0006F46E2A|nr:ARMT1-like domain-containing protein [Devosia sp. Root436]KQX40118.1 hypothetical protein ASD04_05620 [Devosia sp. Root436]
MAVNGGSSAGLSDVAKAVLDFQAGAVSPFATPSNSPFAEYTLDDRLPMLIERVMLGAAGAKSWSRLSDLQLSLSSRGHVSALEQNPFFPKGIWEELARRVGDWRSAPFLELEYYFYLRVLECTGLFFQLEKVDSSTWRYPTDLDPFSEEKRVGPVQAPAAWGHLQKRLKQIAEKRDKRAMLTHAVDMCLYENRTDSSQTVSPRSRQGTGDVSLGPLVIDHTRDLVSILLGGAPRHINIVADNFSLEFLDDLVLCKAIYDAGHFETITVWVKNLPVFVSDVTYSDWLSLRDVMTKAHDAVGSLSMLLHDQRFNVRSSPFLDMPFDFSTTIRLVGHLPEMSAHQDLFAPNSVIIIKGDLNYRKLVGDRLWTPSQPLPASVVGSSQVFCLRAIKSECLIGVPGYTLPRTLEELRDLLPRRRNVTKEGYAYLAQRVFG